MESNPLRDIVIALRIIAEDGGTFRGKTRFHKLVFLTQKEAVAKFDFEFEKAPLGPLSQKLNHLIERMKKLDLIKETIGQTRSGYDVISYSLTDNGKRFIEFGLNSTITNDDISSIKEIHTKYGKLQYGDLLEYVHTKYPEYRLKI